MNEIRWRVFYNHGLMPATEFTAKTELEAKQKALALYRYNYGSYEMVSTFSLDFVVAGAVRI